MRGTTKKGTFGNGGGNFGIPEEIPSKRIIINPKLPTIDSRYETVTIGGFWRPVSIFS